MSLSKRLQDLRRAHKLTQERFGEICGAGKSAVSQWESGATAPTLENLIAIRRTLGTSLDALILDVHIPGASANGRRLLQIYERLDERGRAAVLRVAEAESAYAVK